MSVSVPNFDGGSIPFATIPHAVFIKEAWDDEWVAQEHLRCTQATWVAGPDIDQADLFYHWGTIKRESSTTFDDYEPLDIQDYYVQVRITSQTDGTAKKRENDTLAVFTGIVVDDNRLRLGASSGDQTFKCYGLGHVLDRWNIDYGRSLENGEVVRLGYCPKFNDKGQWGRAIMGNRSEYENPDAESSYDYVYLHSPKPNAGVWNAKEAIDHLLGFSPYIETLPVVLTGQTDALELIKGIWEPKGKTVMQFINELISRHNGLGFRFDINSGAAEGGGDLVEIFVFTLTDEDVDINDYVFPANDNVQPFEWGTEWPTNHLIDAINIRTTSDNTYNDIDVRGANVKVCFSVSFGNQSLDAAWTVDLEQKYNAADGCTNPLDATLADGIRATERFRNVYRKFAIPKDFDWQVGWGTAEEDPDNDNDEVSNIAPITHPDGTVTFDDSEPDDEENHVFRFASMYGKELYRDLPFLQGCDYSESEGEADEGVAQPKNENSQDSNPEYRPMFAWIYDDTHGAAHGPPKKDMPGADDETLNWYYRLDRLTADGAFAGYNGVHNGAIRPVDREMALEITAGHNHYLALGTFDPEAHPTTNLPDFDYTRIGATVFVETDAPLFVRKQFEDAGGELNKTLVVNVPTCEYWYAHPSTTIDVKEGALVTINESNTVIRDDSAKLRSIANILFIWFGRTRRAVTIPIKQIGMHVPVGTFLTTMNHLSDQPEINTVVTAVRWTFDHQNMEIETGYAALDAVGIVEAVSPGKTFAGHRGAQGKGFGGKVGRAGKAGR